MITTYVIEYWDDKSKKYVKGTYISDFRMAEAMYNKSYNKYKTRRLIRTTSEVLYKDKGKK